MHIWRLLPAPAVAFSLLLLACSHGEPFGPADRSSSDPFEPAITPTRLTYGGGVSPAWLPDGLRLVYAYPAAEHANGVGKPDICLGILPASGGRRLASICNPSPLEADTLDQYAQPAPTGDGQRLAFLRSSLNPVTESGLSSIVLGALDSLPSGLALANDGFPGPHGQVLGIGLLRWLNTGDLVFLGSDDAVVSSCPTCDPIIIRRWRDAYRLPVTGGASPAAIPESEFATSIAAGPDNALFLTFAGSNRLFRRDLNSGVETVVDTFDTGTPLRDADYANGKVVLVARGIIAQLTDEVGDPAQGDDKGGELQIVEVATGTVTPLPNPRLFFRHPRLSPDGRSLIAEGYQYQILAGPDTVVSSVADLYRIDLP